MAGSRGTGGTGRRGGNPGVLAGEIIVGIVLNGGNWIDRESTFNPHDLPVQGADQQLQYLAKNYPSRPDVHTWSIAGEDDERCLSRREGVDIEERF